MRATCCAAVPEGEPLRNIKNKLGNIVLPAPGQEDLTPEFNQEKTQERDIGDNG